MRLPVSLQIQADGAPNALALRLHGSLGDLLVEARPTIDLASGHWAGLVTLRHPGAPRLAEMIGLAGAPAWLGDGSLALVAQASGEPGRLVADSFDLTAGALHATGRLALDTATASPLLTGKISAETLPLPLPYPRAPEPMKLGLLDGWRGAIALEAGHVLVGTSPVCDQLAADVSLADRTLHIDRLTARLGGGALAGALVLDAAAPVPTLSMTASIRGATLAGPLFDLPVDIAGGTMDGRASLAASGFSPSALLATLHGDLAVTGRDGQIAGFALGGLVPPPAQATPDDAAIRQALDGGATPFETLSIAARADRGTLVFGQAQLSGPAGTASASGSLNLPAASADLRIDLRPAIADPPEIGLRLTGPWDGLQRTAELAGIARWRIAKAQANSP